MIYLSAGIPRRPVRIREIFFCGGWGNWPCHFWGRLGA